MTSRGAAAHGISNLHLPQFLMKELIDKMLLKLHKVPRLNARLAGVCTRYLAIHENFNYDHDSNGERWLIRTLANAGRLSVCFDVGANQGDWSALVLEESPRSSVHAFEVSPPTYKKLADRLSSNPQVTLNPVGLSNEAGAISLNHCLDSDGLTSMIEVVLSKNTETMESAVIRGKDYCIEHGITKIDLLKIDVEGAENLVMEGFAEFLAPDSIPVIQFEYGMVNIASRFLLQDFYTLLEGRGYTVGKLFPDFVRFREYRFEDEDFRGPNFIAASADAAKLLRRTRS